MRSNVKETLKQMISKDHRYALEMIRTVIPYLQESKANAEGVQYFFEQTNIMATAVDGEDKEALRTLNEFYDRYQLMIHGVIAMLAYENPEEKVFYEKLWSFIEEGHLIPEGEDRLYAWLFVWRDRKIPYFQMKAGMTMENEDFSKISDQLHYETAKANFILNFPFDQKTQRCSQLLDLLDACGSDKERCVLMSKILSLASRIREPLMDKMLEVKRILDQEK